MKSWLQTLRGAVLAVGMLAFAAVGVQGQFGTVAVGTSSTPQSIPVTATSTGTIAAKEAVIAGAQSLDFTTSGDDCPSLISSGSSCHVTVTFNPKAPGVRMGAVLLLDSSNNVLGVTYLSGIGSGGLGVLIPGSIQQIAGQFQNYSPVADPGPPLGATLHQPSAVAFDGAGNLYIADTANNRIRKISPPFPPSTGGIISTFAGTGASGYTGDGGPATSATLSSPTGVAVDGAGNVYIADNVNNAIRVVTPNGNISTYSTGGGQPFNNPQGIAVDTAGNIYVADTNNQIVRKIAVGTGTVTTVAGNGAVSGSGDGKGTYTGDTGAATSAGLSRPYAVAFDSSGNMYIADSANNCIREVISGTISTVAGNYSLGAGYNGDNGAATLAQLDNPSGVAVDAAGNLYISDTRNSAIRKVNAASGIIYSIAVNGSSTTTANGSRIYAPVGIAVDSQGNVFFADYYDMWVQEIQSNVNILNAPTTRQGSISATLTQMMENDGNTTLTISGIAHDTNSLLDSSVTNLCGSTLGLDASCNIGMKFAPTVAGTPDVTAHVTVTDPAVNNPLDIQLIGNVPPVNSTTTVLTSDKTAPGSPNVGNANYKDPVTFTATVTTGTGTLTGNVTFKDGAVVLGTKAVNSSGIATFSSSTLAVPLSVGAHSMTATYNDDNADTAHFASTSTPPYILNVSEPTATTLTSTSLRPGLNSSVTLTATVTTPFGGGVTPDGTVTFYNGATALGPAVTINTAGIATFSTTSLPDGVNALTAVFSGDPTTFILGSTSAVVNVDVLAPSTVALASSPNPSIFGSPVTFTATVTSTASLAPTGSITFLDNGRSIGTATLVGTSGVATFTTSSLIVGSHPITASYSGDTNSGSNASPVDIQVVTLSATNTSIVAAPNPGIAGRTVTLTAKVSETAGTGAISGTVTFTDGTTSLGTATVNSSGVATITPLLGPGAHALVATYNGDSNNAGSASSPLAFSVILATTSTTIASSGSPSYVLAPITLTASVTGNGGTPTGSVTFYFDGAAIGSATLNGSAVATFTYTPQVVGTHNLTATYTGDTNDNPSSSGPLAQVIQPIPTTTSLGETTAGGPPPQAILVATVIGPAGPIPTGTVTFYNGTNVVGQATIDSTGVATLVPDLPKGTYSITATYSGDAIHAPSSSAAFSYTSTPIDFNVSVAPPTVSVATKQNVTVTLTISSIEGYADSIGVGCLSLPAAVNCHFSSDTVNLTAGSTQTVQLTIDTNNPLGGGSSAKNTAPGKKNLVLAGLFFPVSLLFGLVLWRFRKAHSLALFGAMVFFIASAFFVTGCGAFSQASATPGTYTIQVGGVGKNSNVSHYQNVTLTITK